MKALQDPSAAAALVAVLACWAATGPAGADEAIEVLNLQAPWRFHMTYRPPVYGTCEKAGPRAAQPTSKSRPPAGVRWVRWGEDLSAPLPLDDWREVHRTAIPTGLPQPDRDVNWDTAGLCELRLTASGEAAKHVRPNVQPPAGAHLWNASPMLQVGVNVSGGNALEPRRPIELAAPINGFCSGQVVLSSPRPIEGLSAKVGDLRSPAGATIPASAVRARYARLGERFVPLLAEPPADANTIPIWVTVKAPASAQAGRYTGELSLTGPCGPARMGVELTVYGWRMGGPEQWRWIGGSGLVGLRSAKVPLDGVDTTRPLVVRLYFAEPQHTEPGRRVFGVALDGRAVLKDLDIAAEAGGPFRTIVKELRGVRASPPAMELAFQPKVGEPLICGVEILDASPLRPQSP